MLTSLIYYLHTCYVRSYRFGPPTFVFLCGIILMYSVVPNPVTSSYAFTMSFLFVMSAVISYSFIDIETTNQESITLLHSGSLLKLYVAKLLYCWMFTVPLAIFAVLYPALFNMFDRNPTIEELGMSFIYHIVSSWMGVVIACWFSSKFIHSRLMSFLSLSLIILMTLSSNGIENSLPSGIKSIIVLLPPLTSTINVLMNYETATLFMKLSVIGASLLYSLIVALLFFYLLHKRKLDSPQL